jgi:hypothetical protein
VKLDWQKQMQLENNPTLTAGDVGKDAAVLTEACNEHRARRTTEEDATLDSTQV